jgi:hypothetical protein
VAHERRLVADPIYVPVWVLAVRYRDDKPVVRVVINGQTGAATGRFARVVEDHARDRGRRDPAVSTGG